MENKYVCRTIQFCYDHKGFTIIVNSNNDVEYISFYTEICDGDFVGGLEFLFGAVWENQTDDKLISMLIEKYENEYK